MYRQWKVLDWPGQSSEHIVPLAKGRKTPEQSRDGDVAAVQARKGSCREYYQLIYSQQSAQVYDPNTQTWLMKYYHLFYKVAIVNIMANSCLWIQHIWSKIRTLFRAVFGLDQLLSIHPSLLFGTQQLDFWCSSNDKPFDNSNITRCTGALSYLTL